MCPWAPDCPRRTLFSDAYQVQPQHIYHLLVHDHKWHELVAGFHVSSLRYRAVGSYFLAHILSCVIIGYTLVGPLLVLNARPGAVHGITFPAVNRTTYGIFGSLWPVLNRAGMACIWWGVQAWLGGEW